MPSDGFLLARLSDTGKELTHMRICVCVYVRVRYVCAHVFYNMYVRVRVGCRKKIFSHTRHPFCAKNVAKV